MGAALFAAALVAIVHLAYLVYVAAGGFLGLRRRAWLWPHAMAVVWSVSVVVVPLNCPLTALEKWLLSVGGTTPYPEEFTQHYLRGVLYPAQFETAAWLGMIALAVTSYILVAARAHRAHRVTATS